MASFRKVFFSFEWSDVSRAEVVRNSYKTKGGVYAARYLDSANREKVKRQSDIAIKRWIDKQMHDTSVTIVLVGARTCQSRWVKYEIQRTIDTNKGLLEIDISQIGNFASQTSRYCGPMVPFGYRCYRWVRDDGYNNLGIWANDAARKAGY